MLGCTLPSRETVIRPWRITMLSILPDLVCFTPAETVFLILFMGWAIVFSFIDFNHFIDPVAHPSAFTAENDKLWGMEPWRRDLSKLSGAAAFSGALCVVLTNRGKLSSFFWGFINVVTYGAFAAAYGYAGDTLLNLVIYLPAQVIGLYLWVGDMDKPGDTVTSYRLSWTNRVIMLAACAGFAVAFWFVIPPFAIALCGIYYFDGLLMPRLIDSMVCGISVVAQVLLLLQYEEQWLLWIAVDILAIIQWSGCNLPISANALAMYSLYLANALIGYYAWIKRRMEKEKEAAEAIKGDDASSKDGHGVSGVTGVKGELQLVTVDDVSALGVGGDEETGLLSKGSSTGAGSTTATTTSTNGSKRVRGLCVGKFYPFHMGHQHLLSTAARNCDELHIIVCYRTHERPVGQQRFAWVKELNPHAHVQLREDVYDQDDSALWARLSTQWLGFTPDIVFTSEAYGDPWAASFTPHARHMKVDQARVTVPMSGTAARADPLASWPHLTPGARGHYALRIVIAGAESTGKTTLCNTLAAAYTTAWVPEYGAEMSEEKLRAGGGALDKLDGGEFSFTHADFEQVVREQTRREEAAARTCNKVLICDTNAVVSTVWYDRYVKETTGAGRNKPAFDHLVHELVHVPALYMISDVEGAPFVQNGIRDGEAVRASMHRDFVELLSSGGRGGVINGAGAGAGDAPEMQRTPCVLLRGDWTQRERTARACIDALMQGRPLPAEHVL